MTRTSTLPSRPSLDHLRGQAKTLLAELRSGDATAARMFIAHLPKARDFTAAQARSAGFRLADAQSVVARRSGFASWTALVRHVEQLRAIEGEWHFDSLLVDGNEMPETVTADSKLLFDGDRFRMESPDGIYDGRFTIDTSLSPVPIDIAFVEGPEAGNTAYGILRVDGEHLTICLGLVGASRPTSFAAPAGSGHALEHLRRASALRPAGVSGGVAPVTNAIDVAHQNAMLTPDDFATTTSPMLQRLQGAWVPVRLVTNGEEMRTDWLRFGLRTTHGNECRVVFGGQVMLEVKMRIDETVHPVAVDYLSLKGRDKGTVSYGVMEWIGDEVRFLIAAAGRERPANFATQGPGLTLSHWARQSHDA